MNAPLNLSANSSRIDILGDLTLNDVATLGINASLRFMAGSHTLAGTGAVLFNSASASSLNQLPGSSLTIASGFLVHGMRGTVGNATATAPMTNNGTIDSDATGLIDIRAGGGWTNNGTLRASGGDVDAYDTWTNNGAIEVGAGHRLDAKAGLTLVGTSAVTIDIAGSSSFGVIGVTGNAALNGNFTINLTGGFNPGLGESFVVMTYGSRAGAFDSISGTAIGGGKQFSVDIGATSITLTVVAS
jgi:hypothetical protein